MRAHRAAVLIALALGAACIDTSAPGSARLFVNPVLDSLFVGDTLPARTLTFVTASGDTQAAGPARWTSSVPAVLQVDSITGQVIGKSGGIAILTAGARGVTGNALLVVSRPLELALLLDTLYLMPGDQVTVQYSVLNKNGPPPPVTFSGSNSVFSIDAATGVVTAVAQGGPLPFTARADTVSVTGAVEVVSLSDTTGGKAYLTVLGTVIRHLNNDVRAVNYRRLDGTPGFRLNPTISRNNALVESVVITLFDSVGVPGTFAIDELSLEEAFGAGYDAICKPLRSWGLWSSRALGPTITALSVGGGSITISSVQDIAARPGSKAISGEFSFLAERADFFPDSLGILPVRGSFVAPLITDLRPCQS